MYTYCCLFLNNHIIYSLNIFSDLSQVDLVGEVQGRRWPSLTPGMRWLTVGHFPYTYMVTYMVNICKYGKHMGNIWWYIWNTICSMYGIFTNICHQTQPNVGRCSVHGAYGLWRIAVLVICSHETCLFWMEKTSKLLVKVGWIWRGFQTKHLGDVLWPSQVDTSYMGMRDPKSWATQRWMRHSTVAETRWNKN